MFVTVCIKGSTVLLNIIFKILITILSGFMGKRTKSFGRFIMSESLDEGETEKVVFHMEEQLMSDNE